MKIESALYFEKYKIDIKYSKFPLDTAGVKVTNHDLSHWVTIRDMLLKNYIHKLKFPKITTYKGFNKNNSMEKNRGLSL